MPDLDLADLIIRGLAPSNLTWFLPGADHKNAIAALTACLPEWFERGRAGEVTRQGIGEWDLITAADHQSDTAIVFVAWPEILKVIERGCADGHRETYEAAYQAWQDDLAAGIPRGSRIPPQAVKEAEHALIRHGAARTTVQDALF